MTGSDRYPNPDLAVRADNKQGWNQPENRRHGFHNAHNLFRRALMVRSDSVLRLTDQPDEDIGRKVRETGIIGHPAFSALVIARGDAVLFAAHADDFSLTQPHSIQSVSKLHIHLIIGALIAEGHVQTEATVETYLPWIGSAYRGATIGQLLDMNLCNNFSEDYEDPLADCYTEEIALGWRLPAPGDPEPTLRDFVAGLTGSDLRNRTGQAVYKSANTDVLTLVAAAASPLPILRALERIADAAGYEGAAHISLSPEGLPAFSGGLCLSARDLARFGLLLFRVGRGEGGTGIGDGAFTRATLERLGPPLGPHRPGIHYCGHVMTNGRWIGHAGYGGQFLMVDMTTGIVAAYLSVLENASGYDDDYMAWVIGALGEVIGAAR
ncbi:MAG: beta-lactamase family protein [Rhodobacteraceae bacterium]|nr:beta-lactamase family protein [Paracoccaceae bacterium]